MTSRICLLAAVAVSLAADRPGIPLGLDAYLPVPEDNPLTKEKAALGRELFFETRLSRDGSLSCATCHDPKRAFTDGRPVAIGVFGRKGTRRAPTLINRAYGKAFFWDGRNATLEEQVVQPILNPAEMDLPLDEAVARLQPHYPGLTTRTLSHALASYVRTILSGDSPFDRYVAGDREALSEDARLGLRIFRGKGNCTSCHLGPNLTDERFHNTGVGYSDERFADLGRALVSKLPEDEGAFKTPTLREIARTAPYMHDGTLATLDDVVEEYDRGGKRNPRLDPEIRPLHLTPEEKRALVVFLRALSGRVREGM